jgi:hypothetical protein
MRFQLPPLFEALAKGKKYTPLDSEIFRMMLKASIGVDPKDFRGTIPLPTGKMVRKNPSQGPLEMFGPKKRHPSEEKFKQDKLARALASNKSRVQRPGVPTGLSAQAKAKRGEPFARDPKDRDAYNLPARSKLFHSSYAGDAIRKEGFRPSKMGESGPGVYLAPNKYVGKRYPERDLLKVRPDKDLRLLDRTTPRGEKIFRKTQGHSQKEWADQPKKLKEAGYDGVYYKSGKDPEIVVHDPKALKAMIKRRAQNKSRHRS